MLRYPSHDVATIGQGSCLPIDLAEHGRISYHLLAAYLVATRIELLEEGPDTISIIPIVITPDNHPTAAIEGGYFWYP